MKFDDQHVDTSQLQDVRGQSGGGGLGRGATLGGGGLGIIALLIAVFFGVNLVNDDPSATQQVPQNTAQQSDVAVRCNQPGAIDAYDDCFITKIFNETNEIWAGQVQNYRKPTLVFFEKGTRTGCGPASSDTGPFYCPGDGKVYIDLGFMRQLLRRLGAEGRNAQAYVVAHEVGHHIQKVTGQERRVRQLQQQDPRNKNKYSVLLELQADCYAGVWARQANDSGKVQITPQELEQAREAAAAVGDDRIMQGAGMRVNPESFTHGSESQRKEWFTRGYNSGDARQCNTFG